MLNVIYSSQFKKDYKKCIKRGLDINLLKDIVAILAILEPLPAKNREHYLAGNILVQTETVNRKLERAGRMWA